MCRRDWKGAFPSQKWVDFARNTLKPYFDREVVVISLVGKDFSNRKKCEELNDFLKVDVFPAPSTSTSDLDIDVYYSASDNIIFLLVNGPNDVTQLRNAFSDNTKNFFEKLETLEQSYYRQLHLAFLLSHFVVFLEPYPRIDMGLVRTLKNVNKIRLSTQKSIRNQLSSNENVKKACAGGRLATPYLLFGFQKTIIRSELGAAKRKEIIEKLEDSLEDQVYNVFKQCRLIECGQDSSLGQLPEKTKFTRLLFPSKASETIMTDLFDFVMDKEVSEGEDDPGNEIFRKLINQNVSAWRRDKEKAQTMATLETIVNAIELLSASQKSVVETDECLRSVVHCEQNLLEALTKTAIDEAVEQYSWTAYGKDRDRAVFTKAEHHQRFGAAVRYLDGVLVGPREAAMAELRAKCDNLWQGGLQCCEQQSVTGFNCHLPVHSTVGDESVPEKEWEMHDSGVTYISTCMCGRMQTIRRDPFSVKEANYDFYHANPIFTCCKALEKHNFAVVDDFEGEAELEETWHADENWPRPGDEAPIAVFPSRREPILPSSSEESTSETESSPASSEDVSSEEETDSESQDEYGGTRRTYERKGATRGVEIDGRKTAAWEFMKKCRDLETKSIPHTVGVPHSLAPANLPVFPSFSLTCIGSGSLYSHALGLRDQPNFKISSEFLLPVDIPLLVDRESWEQDLEFVNAVEGVGMHQRHRPPRRLKMDNEKVKLFVGFDYECPRGHRFFVDSQGEPLLLSKSHSAREQACRDAGVNVMSADLPLRRQCTCRKLPHQTAQLMKVHIVTPKSPVSVTIDPKIFIPELEGHFCTGEAPLKLAWAKYYILHLPSVYSGPHGIWIPPKSFDRVGTYKGNSIQVTYTPLEKK